MKPKPLDVVAGHYYERRRRGGPLEPAAPAVPDYIVCRRVVDYAPAPIPAAAEVTTCSRCSALVAYNPKGPFQDVPKVCMQCSGVTPLPIDAT